MLRRIASIIIISTLAAVMVFGLLPLSAVHAAPPPVDLIIGGAGSSPWHISNLKPGDHGTQMLTIRNAGTAKGALYIWISDIVDTLAADRPDVPVDSDESWKLSDHLLIKPVSSLLSTTLVLPAVLADYPTSAVAANKITVSPVNAGETIDLIWEWYLPDTVGNAVQANSLTFTLNYLLEEMSVTSTPGGGSGGPSGGPTTSKTPDDEPDDFIFIVTSPEKQSTLPVSDDGVVGESQTLDIISGQITISFERDTRITTTEGITPTELRITIKEDPPTPPEGMEVVGSVYELLFYVGDTPLSSVVLDKPARILLYYDLMEILGEEIGELFVASYNEEYGWSQLQPLEGFIAGDGLVGALVQHFSLYTIFRLNAPEQPDPPLPARFNIDNLSLSVKEVKAGEQSTVRVYVENTGELSGEVLLTLKINGLHVESQLVRLEPGQNRNVSFVVSSFKPGTYEVEVNGLEDVLVVMEGPVSVNDDFLSHYWPMPGIPVLVGAGIILGGIAYFIASRKRA